MGKVEVEDASALSAAKRELREETGLTSQSWSALGDIYPLTGMSDLRFSVWSAVTEFDVIDLDPREATGYSVVDRQELQALLKRGLIHDAITISALSLHMAHLEPTGK